MAAMLAPTLVAFESLNQRTFLCSVTNRQRCGKPEYCCNAINMAGIAKPIADPNANAAKALAILCLPTIFKSSIAINA